MAQSSRLERIAEYSLESEFNDLTSSLIKGCIYAATKVAFQIAQVSLKNNFNYSSDRRLVQTGGHYMSFL